MKFRLLDIRDQDEGSAAVEAAVAIPVLFIFFGTIIQLAMAMFIQASIDHATGEAARFATIHPSPTAAEIETKARESMFGGKATEIRSVNVTMGSDGGRNYTEIKMIYDFPVQIVFIDGAGTTLEQTRRSYQP